jgi:PAS domain S-box-containing protein
VGRGEDSFDRRQLLLLERITSGATLPEVLDGIVRLIEQQSAGIVCSILLLDAAAGVIRHGAAPSLPPEYVRVLDGSAIGPEAGSCGRAAYLAERIVVEDIATHPHWVPYRHLALPHGLRACWSSPIFSRSHEVLGTFAVYYREPRGPTDEEVHWVAAATHIAAIAISHDRSQQALMASERRARQLAQLYAVSSSVNEAITRLKDIGALYEYACRVAVEQGLARLAWVGLYDAAEDRVRPVARFGADDGYVDSILLSRNDDRINRGPAARVLESGRLAVSADIEADPGFFWKHEALSRGLRCCAVFPISQRGRTIGVFALYAGQADVFQAEELRVLDALAADISFAVDSAQAESERQRLEAALRSSEQRLRTLVEATPHVGIQWYDIDGRVLYCNKASERLLGINAELAVGKMFDALNFAPVDVARFHATLASVASTGQPSGPLEFPVRLPDGSIGELLSTVFELPVSEGQRCFVCIDVDLTPRKRLERAARTQERLRELTFRSVVDVLFCVAVEAPSTFRFVSVNPAFLAAVQLDEARVIGRLAHEVLPAEVLATTLAKYEEAVSSRNPVSWEVTFHHPSGIRHGEASLAPVLDAEERCTHLVGTVRDITPRRRAEEERLRLTQQLHHAQRLQALGTLAGGIAHDFNNVLAAITGNVELGLLDTGPEHPAHESLAEIQKATERATDLVAQILAFGRRDTPVREVLDARSVVSEVVRLLRATLPASVELELELAADTPRILANGSQLHQVLMNLGTNAALALPAHKGVVRVSTERVVFAEAEPRPPELGAGCHTRVRVSDTGCGMDEATLARMFEPFFTTRPKGHGTGLGLSVVHGIMQQHEGAVSVESRVGHGSTFSLYFRAADPPVVAEAVRSEPRRAGNGKHILYVDDESALVFLASRGLARAGYRVTTHSDARAALSDFRSRAAEFDAVVTDLSMPGLSGTELARELRRLRPDLPIILLSGYIYPEDVDSLRQLDVGEVMQKPYTVDELALAIERRFQRGASRRAPSVSLAPKPDDASRS